MLDVNDLKLIYAEKLIRTGSHDEAFTKVVWVAYQAGQQKGECECKTLKKSEQ